MKTYNEKPITFNQQKIKQRLEELGQRNVEVWWEAITPTDNDRDKEGGYFFNSAEYSDEHIGLSFAEALNTVEFYPAE